MLYKKTYLQLMRHFHRSTHHKTCIMHSCIKTNRHSIFLHPWLCVANNCFLGKIKTKCFQFYTSRFNIIFLHVLLLYVCNKNYKDYDFLVKFIYIWIYGKGYLGMFVKVSFGIELPLGKVYSFFHTDKCATIQPKISHTDHSLTNDVRVPDACWHCQAPVS